MQEKGKDLKEEELCYKKDLMYVYNESKKKFIKGEEMLPQMRFFAAPIIEHRDALDHIMRYFRMTSNGELTEEALSQLSSALNHEYRAFFDIADYIGIEVRDSISESLKRVSRKKRINKVWSDYPKIRKEIIQYSNEIAKIRQNRCGDKDCVEKYKKILENMFQTYEQYFTEIEPKL